MSTRTTAAALASAVATTLAAHAAIAQDIKIGVLPPFTGPFAAIGQNVKTALDMRASELNAAGGI